MQNILIDAGPLIALFDGKDKYHKTVINWLKKFKGNLITTWPVVTETCAMLDFNVQAQLDFLEWIEKNGLSIFQLELELLSKITAYHKKYKDIPMDFADATLLVAAESLKLYDILTIDSDYHIYRVNKKIMLKNHLLS